MRCRRSQRASERHAHGCSGTAARCCSCALMLALGGIASRAAAAGGAVSERVVPARAVTLDAGDRPADQMAIAGDHAGRGGDPPRARRARRAFHHQPRQRRDHDHLRLGRGHGRARCRRSTRRSAQCCRSCRPAPQLTTRRMDPTVSRSSPTACARTRCRRAQLHDLARVPAAPAALRHQRRRAGRRAGRRGRPNSMSTSTRTSCARWT